jgi:hypothetical protein
VNTRPDPKLSAQKPLDGHASDAVGAVPGRFVTVLAVHAGLAVEGCSELRKWPIPSAAAQKLLEAHDSAWIPGVPSLSADASGSTASTLQAAGSLLAGSVVASTSPLDSPARQKPLDGHEIAFNATPLYGSLCGPVARPARWLGRGDEERVSASGDAVRQAVPNVTHRFTDAHASAVGVKSTSPSASPGAA